MRLARASSAWNDRSASPLERSSRLLRIGDALAALAALRGAGDGTEAQALRARCCFVLGLYARALSIYDSLLAADSRNVSAGLGRARALRFLLRREEAARETERTLSQLEADPDAALAVSRELEAAGDFGRALDVARKAGGQSPEAPGQAAHLLFKLQRLDEARALLEDLLKKNPSDASSRYYLARTLVNPLYSRPDPARSEHLLLENLSENPSDLASLRSIGELFQSQGRHREAAHAFGRLLQLDSLDAAARLQLSQALRNLGELAQATRQREIALDLLAEERERERMETKRNQVPWSGPMRLQVARLAARQGSYQRAWPDLQSAFAITRGGSEAARELAALYRRAGYSPLVPLEGWKP